MELSYTEGWVRFLREVYGRGRDRGPKTIDVEVNAGFPFNEIPENANLPNLVKYSDASSRKVVRKSSRRLVNPPEITVHDAGTIFAEKYQDNFIHYMRSRDVKINPEFHGRIMEITNLFLDMGNGEAKIFKKDVHFRFDRERDVITFFLEVFNWFTPIHSHVTYTALLYSDGCEGNMEIIGEGVVELGEVIGTVYSMEGDVSLQVDFWGGDVKQTEWLMQRFRNLWINQKNLRMALANRGLVTMNLSWSHTGIQKHLDKQLRPYLYNISAMVKFTTEYQVLDLAHEYLYDYYELEEGSWMGAIVQSINGEAVRECYCTLEVGDGESYLIKR